MMKMNPRRARLIRKISVLVAAAPLFQSVGWCQTGLNRTAASTVNALPSTFFSVFQNIALLPLQLLINGGDLGNDNNGLGGGGI